MTTRHELEAWLGPALEDLTPEQVDRLHAEAGRIDARYPDPDDEMLRQAALTATVQYLLGETRAVDAANRLSRARREAAEASAAAQQIGVLLVADGQDKKGAALAVGIDRMTLLKALGER